MQVGNVEMLNCYYAHADTEEGAQVSHYLHEAVFMQNKCLEGLHKGICALLNL